MPLKIGGIFFTVTNIQNHKTKKRAKLQATKKIIFTSMEFSIIKNAHVSKSMQNAIGNMAFPFATLRVGLCVVPTYVYILAWQWLSEGVNNSHARTLRATTIPNARKRRRLVISESICNNYGLDVVQSCRRLTSSA